MQNKRIMPLLRLAVLAVVSVVGGINIYSWNASRIAGNALPMPFGYGASVVLSGSMEPALSVNDLLIVREMDDYQPGDIVVYQSGKTPVVHRIVDISGETVTTRGDANNSNDTPIPMTAVKGKVITAIPKVGQLIWALKSPVAVFALLAAAVLLIESSFRSDKTEKEAEKEKLIEEIRALMDELKED